MRDDLTRRWSQIDALFQEALDLPADERPALLERSCVGDAELRSAVEKLLRSTEDTVPMLEPGGALRGPLWDKVAEELLPPEAAAPGRRVGPYRVVREIGSGGMAEVYLAERADEQFEQQVALKLIQPGRLNAETVRRFEQERQIVASLNHPHIARLLDGGLTDDERPYFAMEYVDGQPVDRYCDDRRLTVEERLELFLVVARAVHYAHKNLLVHRDLKPANIYVTADGQVKLLDFGIAKLLDDEMGVTRTASYWMTPEYASPEQLSGLPATTATDQYQLGFLLFELLTGRRPFEHARQNLVEMVRAICEEAPPPPSTVVNPDAVGRDVVGRDAAPDATRAAARRTTQERLQRRLRGDLDAIVSKALAKQPEARYASIENLIEDVERLLSGLPVQARENTWGYRTQKFIRRHRLAVAAAATFVLLILGYAATVTVQSRQIARQRDLAEAAAERAERVKGFLIGLFESADPFRSPGEEITARQLLDQGAERVERELGADPGVGAELMRVIGRIYSRLGAYDRARPLLEKALETHRQLYGAAHLEVAQDLNDLATVIRDLGDYTAAERMHREALEIRRQLLGEEHPKVAGSLHNLARVLEIRGDWDEAEALLRRALAMDRRFHRGDLHRDVSFDLQSLGDLLAERGRTNEAEALVRQALGIRRRLFGDLHPAVASSLRQLAALERRKGDPETAEALARQALDIHRRVLGSDHREVALDLDELAQALALEGDLEAAERSLREALTTFRRSLDGDHRLVALATAHLGEIHLARGDPQVATALFARALDTLSGQLPERHPEIAQVLVGLGRSLAGLGQRPEAAARLERALDIRRGLLASGDPRTAEVERLLAEVRQHQE